MLSNNPGKLINNYVPNYCIFDLETTGINTDSDEVIEISAIKVENGLVVDEFTSLVNPGMPIPLAASNVNGITDDMVADAPAFEEVLKDFLEFVGDMILVGHNIRSFDMLFIRRDALRYFGQTVGNDYADTWILSSIYLPGLKHHTLVDIAKYYNITISGAHRALNDCRMNQKVYENLAEDIANPSEEAKQVKRCPKCGNVMKKRSGRFGDFWGCASYPECKHTENIR